MTTDPDEIRAQIDAVLAELPDPADVENAPAEADLEELARRLSEPQRARVAGGHDRHPGVLRRGRVG